MELHLNGLHATPVVFEVYIVAHAAPCISRLYLNGLYTAPSIFRLYLKDLYTVSVVFKVYMGVLCGPMRLHASPDFI